MENQHRLIVGYRDLSADDIVEMNRIKSLAAKVGEMVAEVESFDDTDKRWVSIARTHLQQGFMALTRAIAKPESF